MGGSVPETQTLGAASLPSEKLGIQEGGGASQQAPKARPEGMFFWLIQVMVPRVGKVSKRGLLSCHSWVPLPCMLALS